MRVVAVYNLKGGVGKTSATVNIAAEAAAEGWRTLVWDLDPQGAATFYFRVKAKVKGGAEKLLGKAGDLEPHIRGTDHELLDLVPADFRQRHADRLLGEGKGGAGRLHRLLEPLADEYDLVLLDCAPSLSTLSESVFHAARHLLVPVVPTTLSERTLEQVRGFLDRAPDHRVDVWPFFSMVDRRKSLHREVIERLQARDPSFFDVAIPMATEVERMGVERAVARDFRPKGKGTLAYAALWRALRERMGEG